VRDNKYCLIEKVLALKEDLNVFVLLNLNSIIVIFCPFTVVNVFDWAKIVRKGKLNKNRVCATAGVRWTTTSDQVGFIHGFISSRHRICCIS